MSYKIIGEDGREYGPASLEELREWVDDERVAPTTMIWSSEDERWLPASERGEVKWILVAQGTHEPPPLPPQLPDLVAKRTDLAPFGLRLTAIVCDFVLFVFLHGLLTSPWVEEMEQLRKALDETVKSGSPDPKVVMKTVRLAGSLMLWVSFLYYALIPMAFGQTPGKMLARLTVLNSDGQGQSRWQILLRWAASWGCVLTFGFGFVPMFFTPLRQGLHDLVAGTVVAKRRE